MAAGLRFRASVPAELREYLRSEYREYTAKTAMTENERTALCRWVSRGNSLYGNPNHIAGEHGGELDFLAAARVRDELASEFMPL